MDEDKIIGTRYGGIGAPSSPDDIYIGVTRDGHPVYERKDGTRYWVQPVAQAKAWWGPDVRARLYEDYGYDANDPAVADKLREYHTNPDGTIDWSSFPVSTPWQAAQIQARKNPNWRQLYGMTPDINTFNAVTGGIFNQLSPTQLARNLYNIAVQDPNYVEQFVNGNNGLVSDGFAANNPQAAALANLLGDVAILGGPNAVRNVGNLVRNAKPVVENMKQVVDNARNYANYLSRVAAYNNRGRLNVGVPVPDITVDGYTARAALENVRASLANKTAIDPNDIRILNTKAGQSVLSHEGNAKIRSLIYKNAKSPEVELLNKVYTGADLDPSDITALVEDDQLLSTLRSDTRLALREAYDDILYQSLANAENRVEAANNILSKLRTPKYRQQILDEITPPKPAVTPEPTPTPEPAAAKESVTIEATPQPAAPARPKTLVERWMEIYPGMHDMKFGRPGKKFGNQSGYYNTISDANGNIVPNKIGFEGNTFTLTEEGGKPMISGEIRPGDVAKQIREDVYNPKWYSIADQGADPNLGKVRKWFWKPSENLNAKVRTNQGDITVTGPGVDRTKLSNWLRGGVGLTGAGLGIVYGVPAILGGIKSLFGGSGSDQPQRVVYDMDGMPHLIDDTHFTNDSLRATINNKLVSVGRISNGNFKVIPDSEAEKEDAYNAKQQATNQNSGPVTIKQNVDTLSIE